MVLLVKIVFYFSRLFLVYVDYRVERETQGVYRSLKMWESQVVFLK